MMMLMPVRVDPAAAVPVTDVRAATVDTISASEMLMLMQVRVDHPAYLVCTLPCLVTPIQAAGDRCFLFEGFFFCLFNNIIYYFITWMQVA